MREGFKKGQIIQLNTEDGLSEEFTISNVCGMGAEAVVYDAFRKNGKPVRIKEFYPLIPECSRSENGELTICGDKSKFYEAEKQFKKGYELQVKLRKEENLTNSIIPVSGLYYGYGTFYIVTITVAGRDLEKFPATSISSLIKIAISVSKVISFFHKLGYLHLDIKPSNIFRIPETDEHVMLFDFDSLIEKEKLNDCKTVISYSPNWAAPELKRADWKRIAETADIYSIGCIVFSGIFGRNVCLADRENGAEWDYRQAKESMIRNVDTALYEKLAFFFHKTLASSISRRFSDMDMVTAFLKDMLKLADQENRFIYPKIFPVQTPNFVGRYDALSEIDAAIMKDQAVCLYGMDGLGKTDVIREYVRCKKDKFEKVVMVDYAGSLAETIMSEDVRINKFGRLKNQSDSDYYDEKIRLLGGLFSPADLLIIDGYEINDTDEIQDLLALPCRKIVISTSSMDDLGIKSVELKRLSEEECLEVFRNIDTKIYSPEDISALNEILKSIDYHTLTAVLIAKYLKYSGEYPYKLQKKLNDCDKSELFNDIKIRGILKGRIYSGTITEHLKQIYDMSGMERDEKEIMLGMSLMEKVKISRHTFRVLFDWKGNITELNNLAERGWLIIDSATDRISLHPVIRQIAYLDKPDTENCSRFIKSFIDEYDREKTYFEDREWRRLFGIIFGNISGNDILYAALCRRDGSRESLIKASDIYRTAETNEYLDVSLSLFGKETGDILDSMGSSAWGSNLESDKYVELCINQLIDRFKEEFMSRCKLLTQDVRAEYMLKMCDLFCFDILEVRDDPVYLMAIKPREDLCKRLADFIRQVLGYVERTAVKTGLDDALTYELLSGMEKFFIPSGWRDFTDSYLADENTADRLSYELRPYREKNPETANISVYDGNLGITTYDFEDGSRLYIYDKDGVCEWANTWNVNDIAINPFNLYADADELHDFSVRLAKREDVMQLMESDGAEEYRYNYYCALADSQSLSGTDAERIWMKAFGIYYYDLRDQYSGAKESAYDCLKHIDDNILFSDHADIYCSLSFTLGNIQECIRCYREAALRIIRDGNLDHRGQLTELELMAYYAEETHNEDEAVIYLICKIIKMVGKYDITLETPCRYEMEEDTLADKLKKSLSHEIGQDCINDIAMLFEEKVLLFSAEKYRRMYDILYPFLKEERCRAFEFIE